MHVHSCVRRQARDFKGRGGFGNMWLADLCVIQRSIDHATGLSGQGIPPPHTPQTQIIKKAYGPPVSCV